MKKILGLLMIVAFLALPTAAFADPAPPLTDIQIWGVTSDGESYVWENIADSQSSATIPMSGTTGYLAIYVEGTQLGSYPAVFNNGNHLTTTEALPPDYITDSLGNVIGKLHYRQIDLSTVTTGDFTVQASNYYPPNQTYYDHLYIEVN